jgi:AcrR family transcriptional regulator
VTREQVVRAAVTLADREGLAGLSMRRIAADLGVATMSLYRYVRNKDDLLVLMMEAVFVDHPLPTRVPPGWRAQLEAAARLQWSIYRRHPWLAPAMSFTRPPLARSAMAHTEWAMRALDGHGLPTATIFRASVTLAISVRGTAVNFEPEALAEQDTGLTDDEWMNGQAEVLGRILASGRFPMMLRAVNEPGFTFDLSDLFEFGLRQLLDGLAAQIGD